MADANPEDLSHGSGPESSTGCTTPRAPKKSRPTAARKSSGVIQTRARKLRAAAASRIRKSPAGSTPNSRPRSQASRKKAAPSKAATTLPLAKTLNVTTAEAAAAITPILRPPTLRFEAPQQPETGPEIRKGAAPATQAASEDTGSSSSSPASPVGRKAHLLSASRDAIAAFLSGFPATARVRVNHRRNLIAVDTTPTGDVADLLQISTIVDIPVKVKVLVENTCMGEVFGVDPDIHLEDITSNISSSVGIVSCTRRGNTLRVTFEGITAPEELILFKQRRPVRACLPRPLQCNRCGVYGHAAATCSRDRRCLRCGRSHTEGPCTAENPRCLHCKGRHPANEPRCSSWQLQRQTAFILATSGGKLTRRQALEKAQAAAHAKRNGAPAASTTRPGYSFRDAIGGTPTLRPSPSRSPCIFPRRSWLSCWLTHFMWPRSYTTRSRPL
ncbi:hypothetical protein HPB52_024664 [Rhipicephalus sanguineus]|uniref:Gag-like protein n=1 Tax=Rhipicephalus sanguineus TaxID=34632 RepID=A0A9D4TE12_RHISA|nr:hypothetical protein HPB52_024664 [Rhipicephalus sanguineus]